MARRKKEDLIIEVANNYDYSVEELQDMKYGELTDLLKRCEEAESQLKELDELEAEDDTGLKVEVDDNESDERPKIHDYEWTEWVMSQFHDSELVDGKHPTVDSLRRMTERVFGPYATHVQVVQTPDAANSGRATVSVSIMFADFPERNCSSAADVFYGNTEREYAVHPVATAETRAEGRALRKALRLSKVITAEESYVGEESFDQSNELINNEMVTTLKVMSQKTKIDAHKLAVYMGYDIQVLSELKHKEAIQVMQKLSKMSRGEEEVPDEVRE